MGSCRETEVPKGAGDRDISNLQGLPGWQWEAAATCCTSREPVGTERMGKCALGVFWRKFCPRDAKLAVDFQDQSLPLEACPLRAA